AAAWKVSVSDMASALLADEYDPVGRAGHGSADVDQIALRVDLLHAKGGLRVTLVAIMAGHLLSLDYTRGVRTRSDRTRLAMLRAAVRTAAAGETVTLHDALEAATLRRTGHLHPLAQLEDPDGDRVAHGV